MSGRLPKSLQELSRNRYLCGKTEDSAKNQIRILELEAQCRSKNDEIGDLRLQRYHLEQLVTSLRADRNQMQDRIFRQHRQLRHLEEDFNTFKGMYDGTVEELKKCQDVMMKTGHEMLEMAEEIADYRAQIQKLESNVEDYHGA